ncbi:MAG: helix-turn-helix transcriptional regulator [Bacteroides sp.]|nr:helix-turn-helix transcriptional regulator [Bacteroides sp.]
MNNNIHHRHYPPLLLVLLTIVFIAFTESGCHKHDERAKGKERMRLDSLFSSASDAARKDNFAISDSLGMVLYKEARANGDKVYEAYGLLARGFYPKTSEGGEERLPLVHQAEELALTTDNDTLLSWVYNVLGIYATVYECNFSQARHYYSEAIKHAKRINATQFIVSAECNIAELYHSVGDTLGHTYDLDIYKYALENNNKALLLPAAQRCAEYYIEYSNRPERAMPYIKSVWEAGSEYLYHLLQGKYYIATDSAELARHELELALQQECISPNVYLTYGKLLNNLGNYAESNNMLRQAEEAYYQIDSRGSSHIETWRVMSDNYRKLDNVGLALNYLDLYINGRDSVNNLRNQEEINTYKVRFDVEKKELELARNRETMKRQSITLWAIVIILVIAGGFYLFYTLRKRSMHRLIVRQQKDFLMEQQAKETDYSEKPEFSEDSDNSDLSIIISPSEEKTSVEAEEKPEQQKGLSAERADAIWELIEHEMNVNKIYADTTVTRDIFSERVGCNHTWFSQVIKERTGKSYLQFMNSRRIKEAVRILSNPTSEITQKDLAARLGFLSASTFYSTFKQQMGMSPAEYRKLALSESTSNNPESME